MRLQVLGTAAGGGVPQWNCACPGCTGARTHLGWRRRHACLAVQLSGECIIVNATPDLAEQLESCAWLAAERSLAPHVALTDAELDHTIGLLRLREAARFTVSCTPSVRQALRPFADILRTYASVTWRDLEAIPISCKRPRYADSGDVSALRFRSRGKTVVYAPAMGTWNDALFAEADVVFVDGTFWDEQEPQAFCGKTATEMGHLPIEATMERLSRLPGRCLYTHLNNTNPLVDPDAPHHKVLGELGLEVAADGMVIEL